MLENQIKKGDIVKTTGSQEPLGEVEDISGGYIIVRITEKKISPKPHLVPFRAFELTKCNMKIQEKEESPNE